MPETVKILSIDGGGIRGIIPAYILSKMEEQTKKPLCEIFDLIAGTSVGGILALGLTTPNDQGYCKYTAKEILNLFETERTKVFNRSILRRILTLNSLIEERYSAHGLEQILDKHFNNAYLSQSLTNVLVTAYELETRMAYFFKSHKSKNNAGSDFLAKDAARATSAAPTYFEPAKVYNKSQSRSFAFIDGGVFANNPAMCALAEAKKIFPDAQKFLVVSLGTGTYTEPILYQNAKNWGLVHWARPLLSVVFDGVSDTVDYQLKRILNDVNQSESYFRFQVQLDKNKNTSIDNISDENIAYLKSLAEELMNKEKAKFLHLCSLLCS
jgi:uncharacterized protein